MDNLRYAMQKSYNYMVEEINDILKGTIYSDTEKQRLFYACGTCLHWILDYAERVTVSEEDKRMVSAFRFANNALKHDKTLLEITEQTGGFSFSFSFPMEIPAKKVCWKEIEDNGKYESQYNNYIDYLCGKSLIDTCRYIMDILIR